MPPLLTAGALFSRTGLRGLYTINMVYNAKKYTEKLGDSFH